MNHLKLLIGSFFLSTQIFSQVAAPKQQETEPITLPNGWSLSAAGKSLPLGDLPLNIAVSNSKRLIAITNNGESTQSLQLVDSRTEARLDSIDISASWLGLAFSADEKWLYASAGNKNQILKYSISHNRLKLSDSLVLGKSWPEKISPAGLTVDDSRSLLYVVTKENNSLYIFNLITKAIVKILPLGGEGYTCILSPDHLSLYISCWGRNQIRELDCKTFTFLRSFATGDHPNDICIDKKGKYLYVANANDNSVSVIDRLKGKTIETLNAALFPDSPPGSTTNSLALSDNDKTLYVANADNNCLAVFDVSIPGRSYSRGFIPVGWYPTCVRVVNRQILVANGKGFSSMANPFGPNPVAKKQEVKFEGSDRKTPREVQYIGGLFKGTLSIIPEPDDKKLGEYSAMVYRNTPYSKSKEWITSGEKGNPVPRQTDGVSPIKYVFYIIKENRTYDQVLGDIKEGNGDTSLVLFGEKVTPNLHSLAREFVLLDNFYCDAEVSADGHNWSMGAYATDYLEKTWPTSYGGRGGDYDAEGNRAIANNKNGFIWDHCKRAGISYRTYGEFADNYKPNIPVLKDHYCPYYTSWDQTVRDTTRVSQWKRDFDSLLAAGALPRLNTLRIINDHTEGLRNGRPTPFAHVADNDLACGLFVEYLSQSPVWKESVVFILEDDAQNGPDHVDAHRSPAYIAGGYVKRHFVDHTLYSTTSMLRTIELILGIAPMSQYDAAAESMWRSFSTEPDLSPFHSVPAQIDLKEKNIVWNELSAKSASFDFAGEDRVPEDLFNEVLWKGIRGLNTIVPAPRRAAFVRSENRKDGDD